MKPILLLGTGLAAAWAGGAFAQAPTPPTAGDRPVVTSPSDTTPTGAGQAADEGRPGPGGPAPSTAEVLVTGQRRANNAAIEAKRDANNIIDAVGSNEVRSLPDNTVVEALRRVPGLAVFPTNDNEHTQDEEVTPVIRGLGPSYNNVTVDGLEIASPGTPNGVIGNIQRGVRLDLLPVSIISQLQVVKTFTADLDPNAVGGAINIVTRSAFEDGGKPFFTFEGGAGHATDVGVPRPQSDPGYRFVVTGSDTFGSAHQFGFTLSGNYEKLSDFTEEHATIDTVFDNFYNNAGVLQSGAALGNGIPVPQQDRYWYAQNDRTRYGVTGKFEAHPAANLDAYVTAGFYDFKTHYQRNEVDLGGNPQPTLLDQTPTTGTYQKAYVQIGYIDDNISQQTTVGQVGLRWRPDSRQVLTLRGSASYATYNESYPMYKYASGTSEAAPGVGGDPEVGTSNFGFTYDTSKFDYRFNIPPSQYFNLNNYELLYYRPYVNRVADDQLATARLDYAFNQDGQDRGLGFGAGLSYIDDQPDYSLARADFEANTNSPSTTLAGAAGPIGAPFQYAQGLSLITINPQTSLAQIAALTASGSLNKTNQTAFNTQDDFTHHETNLGAYALATFKTDRLLAEAGVHVDDTHQRTVGETVVNGAFQPTPTRSSYLYPLPSGLVVWHATPDLDLRGGVSETIGRPSYDTYAPRSSVVFANVADQGNSNAVGVLVTQGNPDLKPRRSTNYDLAVDWTPSRRIGGILSADVFYKDIKDEIYTSNTLGFTYQGVTYANAQVSRPENSTASNIKGVELNGVLNSLGFLHPYLSGFGASGNVSLLAGRISVPLSAGGSRSIDSLVDQPSVIENVSVFYAWRGLELKAAWNRQGRALRAIQNDIYWQDLYWAPREQLDLSAVYALRGGFALFAQASNVTHQRIVSVTGPDKDLLRNDYTVPTIIWAGVRFTPHL